MEKAEVKEYVFVVIHDTDAVGAFRNETDAHKKFLETLTALTKDELRILKEVWNPKCVVLETTSPDHPKVETILCIEKTELK